MAKGSTSILRTGLRAMVGTMFAVIGLGLGFFVIALLFSGAGAKIATEPEQRYALKVAPNAKGKRKVLDAKVPVILELDVSGLIGTERLNGRTFSDQLIESREGVLKGSRVKAILLRVNSPGGTIDDSDIIYRSIKQYKRRYNVPVYVHIDGMCASGAVYLAAAADKVYASEVSVYGSIGVFSGPFFNVSSTLEKVGIEALTITAGKSKDLLNPTRPWEEGEEQPLKDLVEYYYDHFVKLVTNSRPQVTVDQLKENIGANILPASRAEELGLIDGTGYERDDVLQLLAKEAGIEAGGYQVFRMERSSWINELFRGKLPFDGTITHRVQVGDLPSEMSGRLLYLYRP